MTVAAVHERVREVLFHDWEGEYNRIKMSNGGQMPQYSEVMIEKCFDGGHVAPCSGEYPLP